MNKKPVFVDGKRIINPHEAEDLSFKYYGVEFPVHPMEKLLLKNIDNILRRQSKSS